MNLLARFLWLLLTWRFRSRLGYFDEAETPFRVWPTDLDPNLHMNNGIYLSLLDLGRFDLGFRGGWFQEFTRRGWYPVVASQTIRYRKALDPFRRFSIRTRLLGWDDRFVYILQRFMLRGEVAALAVVKARFLSRQGDRVSPSQLAEAVGENPVSPPLPAWVHGWTGAEDAAWKEIVG